MSDASRTFLTFYSAAVTLIALWLGVQSFQAQPEPKTPLVGAPAEGCGMGQSRPREDLAPRASFASQFINPPDEAAESSVSTAPDPAVLREFGEQHVRSSVDRYLKITPEQRERLIKAAMAQISFTEDGSANGAIASAVIETEEDILGKETASQLYELRKKREEEMMRIQSERTLFQLVDALQLELSSDQKELALRLLANQDSSTDISADQEVSLLSHRLSLTQEQSGKVREVLSTVYAMGDEEFFPNGVPENPNGTEADPTQLRNKMIADRLRGVLTPSQIQELVRIQDLETS